MKTTVEINDALFQAVKKMVAERKTTLRVVMDSALRQYLAEQQPKRHDFKLLRHSFKGQGLQPGLSESDWPEIRRKVYEGRGG